MKSSRIEEKVNYINSLLDHQPKNQERYEVIVNGELSQLERVAIIDLYEGAGWDIAQFTLVSENSYKFTLTTIP